MTLKSKGYLFEAEFEYKHIETFSFKSIQILARAFPSNLACVL